jgi:outer membrane protein TolC
MKDTLLRLTIASALLAPVLAAAAEAPAAWSLRRAVAEAREASPDAAVARGRLEAAEALGRQAGAAWWPHLALHGGYLQTDQPMQAFGTILNTGVFNPAIDFNRPGQVDHLFLAATVSYPIYQGGAATAARSAARAGERAARADQEAISQQLAFAAVRAWHGILQARSMVAALDSAASALDESLRVASARFERGQLLKNELLDIEVQLAQTRSQLLAARQHENLAGKSFQVLLGQAPTGAVVLDTSDADSLLAPPPSVSVDARPELAAMRARIEAAEAMTQAARAGRQPAVDAFASYQYDKGWRLRGDGDNWTAGVRVNWAVFDGHLSSGRLREANAQLAVARAEARRLSLDLQLQLASARLAHELARSQLEVTARQVEQAAESAAISRARFESGDLLSAELIGAETRLMEARMRRSMAATSERVAAAELRRAAGLPLF